jgi:hypothetical protein
MNIKVVLYVISRRRIICKGYECQISGPVCFEFGNVREGTLPDLGAKPRKCSKDAGNQIMEDGTCGICSTRGIYVIMYSNFWSKKPEGK